MYCVLRAYDLEDYALDPFFDRVNQNSDLGVKIPRDLLDRVKIGQNTIAVHAMV